MGWSVLIWGGPFENFRIWGSPFLFGYGVVRPMNARRWGGPSAGWDMGWSRSLLFGYGVVFPWSHMGWSVPKAFGYRVVRLCSEMGWSRSLVFGYGVVLSCSHMGWSVPKAVGYGVVPTANDQYATPGPNHRCHLVVQLLKQLPPSVGTTVLVQQESSLCCRGSNRAVVMMPLSATVLCVDHPRQNGVGKVDGAPIRTHLQGGSTW